MVILASGSIVQAAFVVGYRRDISIRTKQFEIEKVMQPLINVPSVSTNLPDEFNPQAPRVTFSQGKMVIHFSQIAAQITINVDNTNDTSPEMIRESISAQIELFQDCVDKVVPREQQLDRGLVLTLQYPVASAEVDDEDMCEYIQTRFLRIAPLGTPASAAFNVGYKTEDNFFITLSVTPYKSAAMPAEKTSGWLDIFSLPVTGSGIQLMIDVNSRPLKNNQTKPENETGIILGKSFDFALSKADVFMGII